MPSIGSQSFALLNLRGGDTEGGQSITDISRPGTNGNAFRQEGARAASTFYDSLVDLTSAAQLKTRAAAYKAMQGDTETLTDDHGNTYQVLVKSVQITQMKRAALVSGGVNGGEYLLGATWEVVFL